MRPEQTSRPEKDGGGLNSVNAGIPFGELDAIAQMRLTSAASFARDTGILAASALRTSKTARQG